MAAPFLTRLLGFAALSGCVVCSPMLALAQAPTPDAVVLTNGAMFRGTVTEAVPGQHVTVSLATGSSRTFEWSEVRYAGPAAERPPTAPVPPPPPGSAPSFEPRLTDSTTEGADRLGASPPSVATGSPSGAYSVASGPESVVPPAPATPSVPVRFRSASGDERLRVSIRSRNGDPTSYVRARPSSRPVCSTPCETRLSPGSYRFALSNGGTAQAIDEVIEIRGPTSLAASYNDRRPLRTAGWILLIAANVVGAVVYSLLTANEPGGAEDDLAPLLVGGGIAAAGTGGGLAMILARDQVSLELR